MSGYFNICKQKHLKFFIICHLKKSQMALGKGNKVFVYLTEKSSVFIIIYSVNRSNILYFSELMFMYIVTSIHA